MRRVWMAGWGVWFGVSLVAMAFVCPGRSQAQAAPTQSVVEAAKNARDQEAKSPQTKVITNDDLEPPVAAPQPAPATAAPGSGQAGAGENKASTVEEAQAPKKAEAATEAKTGCDNPNAERIQMELQAAENERDQLRSDLSYDPKVISGGDVDLSNFKSGGSGVDIGSPPLLQSAPQAPARVDEVMVNQKIASLKEALKVACGAPEDAGTQRDLYAAQQRLGVLQQEYALDQNAFYSKTDYSNDSEGKAKLDAEQQEIAALQEEIERLKSELAESKTGEATQ